VIEASPTQHYSAVREIELVWCVCVCVCVCVFVERSWSVILSWSGVVCLCVCRKELEREIELVWCGVSVCL